MEPNERRAWGVGGGVICLVVAVFALADALNSPSNVDDHQAQSFPEWAIPPAPWRATLQATGVIDSVDVTNGAITLDHGLSQSMGWPTLIKVRYLVLDGQLMQKCVVGKRVTITFRKRGSDLEVIDVSTVDMSTVAPR